ncbi:MAG: ABC transporter permease [Natronospirillum sp.]
MKVWTIARWEFARFFKWKQELLSLLFLLVVVGAMAGWELVQSRLDEPRRIAWLSAEQAPDWADFEFVAFSPSVDPLSLLDDWPLVVRAGEYEWHAIAAKRADWQDRLMNDLQQHMQQARLQSLVLPADQQSWVDGLPPVEWLQSVDAAPADDEAGEAMVFMLFILLVIGYFTGFGYLFSAITKEKQQRVTEQLLTLVTPQQWMDGKILGITLHCVKTMVVTGLYFLLIFQGVVWFLSGSLMPISLSWLGMLALPYILLGLLLVNALMAGFAAIIDDPNHSAKTYLMFIPAAPIAFAFALAERLDGVLAFWLSMVPLTSFAVMPMRLVQGGVAAWEVAVSLIVLVAMVWLVRKGAQRIFALGIQTYGQEPSWGTLFVYLLSPKKIAAE